MKIVIASDSFKGSLSSLEVAKSIEKGLKRADTDIDVIKVAMADGGDGTMEALVLAKGGFYKEVKVMDPVGREIVAHYGVLDKETVIIEMAAASGLALLKASELSPLESSTFGTGQMINDALASGYKNIYIGLGGSATNDGGAGMAQAIGVVFLDKEGREIVRGNKGLKDIHTIDISGINPKVKAANFTILSDVNNPLVNKGGAAKVFAAQKGASVAEISVIDKNLSHYADKIKEFLNIDIKDIPGSGAAGGLGAGLLAFTKAEMESGVYKMIELLDLKKHLKDADILITGEGQIDGQSIYGKTPIGVAYVAKKYDVFVAAIVGSSGDGADKVYDYGIDMIVDIIDKPMSLESAIKNSRQLLEKASFNFLMAYKNMNI